MKKVLRSTLIGVLLCSLLFGCFPTAAFAAAKPKKVSNRSIQFSSVSYSSCYVKWKKAKGAKKYQVGYRVSNSKKWKYQKTSKTKCKLSGLKDSTSYSVIVRSINGNKKSKWSQKKTVKTSSFAQKMLKLVNAERKKVGAKPLALYGKLQKTAVAKSKDMYKHKSLDHYSSTLGGYFDAQFHHAEIDYLKAGENIAYGHYSMSVILNAWMHSPGHRSNILDKNYTHAGFAYYKGYWTQQFVQDPTATNTAQ